MPTRSEGRNRVRRHREVLDTRREYLEAQIDRRRADGAAVSYALAERAAIKYALAVLDDVEAVGLLHLAGRMNEQARAEMRECVEAWLEDEVEGEGVGY